MPVAITGEGRHVAGFSMIGFVPRCARDSPHSFARVLCRCSFLCLFCESPQERISACGGESQPWSLRASCCVYYPDTHQISSFFSSPKAYGAEHCKMACMCCFLSSLVQVSIRQICCGSINQDSLKTFDAAAPDHGSIADDSRGLRAGELWFDPSSPTKSADPHAGCMVGVCAPSASGR